MSGHSKWNNIKHKKEASDAKRSKAFSQISKQIRIAVKEGGSADPQFNPTLRTALDKARAANMPKDKVGKAIDKGLGKSSAGTVSEILYEAFGSQGEAYLISVVTDNPNRASADVKFVLSRNGGSLGGPNSARYLFDRTKEYDYVAKMPLELDGSGQTKVKKLVEQLREMEDVEDVYVSVKVE